MKISKLALCKDPLYIEPTQLLDVSHNENQQVSIITVIQVVIYTMYWNYFYVDVCENVFVNGPNGRHFSIWWSAMWLTLSNWVGSLMPRPILIRLSLSLCAKFQLFEVYWHSCFSSTPTNATCSGEMDDLIEKENEDLS